MKRILILQSNYIPWKGYFDMIHQVDEFVIYDDVQFTKNDWRNRNKIKTANGLQWLSIPVFHSTSQKINEIMISDSKWNRKHWNAIRLNYAKAAHFGTYKDFFEDLYLSREEQHLSEINLIFIKAINQLLNIKTVIRSSTSYSQEGDRSERLIAICKQAGAQEYLSGPAAKEYLEVDRFDEEQIRVIWMDYDNYPAYEQLHPPFDHRVTVLDVLFNAGPEAERLIKIGRPGTVNQEMARS